MCSRSINNKSGDYVFNSLLIVEPDRIQRKGLLIALMDYFKEIVVVSDQNEAITALDKTVFNFIITEINFDTMKPIEYLRYIRLKYSAAVIVVITSEACSDLINGKSEFEPALIIEKPFKISDLIGNLKKISNPERSN